MNGYQFAHTQTYSLKGNKANRSVKCVLGENSRMPGQHNHVNDHKPPNILMGIDPIEVLKIIERRISDTKAQLKGTGKRFQSNTHVMEGSVFSHPLTVDEMRGNKPNQARYVAWRNDMVKYAIEDAKNRGMETLSVVEHLDENHPHIHVISIPFANSNNPRLDAKVCHAGHMASKLSLANGENAKMQMLKYREAMVKWQDDIHENVSIKHGLTRAGPRRARLTGSQWANQKADAEKLKNLIEYRQSIVSDLGDVEKVRDDNTQLLEKVNTLTTELSTLKTEYEALRVNYSDLERDSEHKYNDLCKRANIVIDEKDVIIRNLTPNNRKNGRGAL